MLKRIAILLTAVIAFVGCFLLVERQASPFFQSCISQGGDSESKQSSKEGDSGIGTIVLAYARCSGRFIDGHGSGITALFTIVLAASTILLWLVTNKAAEAARVAADHIPRVERAYLFVVVNGETIRHPLMAACANANSTNQDELIDDTLDVEFSFENQGKTPAIIREISVSLHHWSQLPAVPPAYTSELKCFPTNRYVAPGKLTEIKAITVQTPITRESASSLLRGDSFIWFFGRAIYDDVFGDRHEHAFIWRYSVGYFLPYYGNDKYEKNT